MATALKSHGTSAKRQTLLHEKLRARFLNEFGLEPIQLRPGLSFAPGTWVVKTDEEEVMLTAREVDLLCTLLQDTRRYFSAAELARALNLNASAAYDPDHALRDHQLQQTITRLRKKLGDPPHRPCVLRSRPGVGYRLFIITAPPMHYPPAG